MKRGDNMLIQFGTANYMSFKNETVLSACASADKSHQERLIKTGKDYILPSVVIYGANAAGKSNLFKAIKTAVSYVRDSDRISNTAIPFLFDETSIDKESKFDFSFIYNNKEYDYGFSILKDRIIDEYLYVYNSQKPTLIFERSNTVEYKFSTANKKELSQYIDKTDENRLFLSCSAFWNCKQTKDAYMWFKNGISIYDSQNLDEAFVQEFVKDYSKEMKSFVLDFVNHADLNIDDFMFRSKKLESISQRMDDYINRTSSEWNLDIIHKVKNGEEEKLISLPYSMESAGTRKVLSYGPIIRNVFKNGSVLIIDEIDSSLHPSLVRYLIDLFNDSSFNTNGAQLIFNTHDVSLLDQDIFRRDQVYFVEKDNSTGISDLYSLSEFSPRKSEDIRKGYLTGRYGAIPIVVSGGIGWED